LGGFEWIQKETLEAWCERRRERATEVAGPGAVAIATVIWGRVEAVVNSDEQWGAHLQVVPVRFEGRPPTVVAASGPVLRCYPPPGRSVSDFSVGQIVKVYRASGGAIAEAVL